MAEDKCKAIVEKEKNLIEDYKKVEIKANNVTKLIEQLNKQRDERQKTLKNIIVGHTGINEKIVSKFQEASEINENTMKVVSQQQHLKVELSSKIYVQNSVNRNLQQMKQTLNGRKNRLQKELEINKKTSTDISLIQNQLNSIDHNFQQLKNLMDRAGNDVSLQITTMTSYVKKDALDKVVSALGNGAVDSQKQSDK